MGGGAKGCGDGEPAVPGAGCGRREPTPLADSVAGCATRCDAAPAEFASVMGERAETGYLPLRGVVRCRRRLSQRQRREG